jgi:hypothetical protein
MKNFVLKICAIGIALLSLITINAQTNPTPHDLSSSNYTFTGFASGATTAYPTSMQGHGFAGERTVLNKTDVASGDRAMAANSTAFTTNSIRNEVADGISFLFGGTTTPQVGTIVVALDATNRQDITLTWTCAEMGNPTIGNGDRQNAIELQYRIGTSGTWTSISGTTYLSNLLQSPIAAPQTFSNITLPADANNQVVVEVRWLYYYVTGSGSRDRIRVDDITISSSPLAALCSAPATQASAISFSSIMDVSAQVNWINGSGDGRVVIMNSSNSFTAPTNGSNPSANTAYSGAGEQVVFNGTGGGPISITNLSPGTTYWFRVYEFCNPDRVYQTATATDNPNSVTTAACLASTHYFRTIATGNWNTVGIWESSADEISWSTPACAPDFNANTIRIRNGHTVTLNTALDVDQIFIENGGVLRKVSGGNMNIRNGAGDDVIIQEGGVLEYAGASSPTYQNADVRIRVQTGGRIRINNNVAGLSGNLAGNGSVNRIIYEHESIFEWNTTAVFQASGQTYFPNNTDQNIIATFLITQGPTLNIGGASPFIINGLTIANGNLSFSGSGQTTFRNGILGSGSINQVSGLGRFFITGATAVLGGTGSLNLNFERLEVTSGVNLTIASNKIINSSNTDPALGQIRILNGSQIDLNIYELSGTANILFNSNVIIRTSHPNGLDGAIGGLAGNTFSTPQNQTLIFNLAGAQNTGSTNLPAACGNLITGSGTILTLQDSLEVNSTLNLGSNSIIHVDPTRELYVSNDDAAAISGGTLTGTTNFITGPLRWATDNSSYNFPVGFNGYGAQGFTIDVTGTGDVRAFLETNSTVPLQGFAYCDIETKTTPLGTPQQIGQGAPGADGFLDQIEFDLESDLQWNITNPGGGISSYNLTVSANGSNDIIPVIAADGTPIRYLFKNGEPGNTGLPTGTAAPEFTQVGFLACPNGYTLTGMTGFSAFTIHGASPSNTVLPIELMFFTSQVTSQNTVLLNWATASELNNDFFTVERSLDGLTWEVVEFVNGNGTTPLRNDYNSKDVRPYIGLSYYRLKQTDFDGTFEYSNIVSVFVASTDQELIKVVNIIGQTVDINTPGLVILIFNNGETLKIINE